MPPGCSSENPASVQEFITKAKAALISVGIVRDTILCKYIFISILSDLSQQGDYCFTHVM